MALVRHLLLSIANGYILYFYSERLFWGMWRTGDALVDVLFGVVFYTLSGYLLLTVLRWMHVRNWAGLFIAGCIFGWLVEGVWAPTLYGTEPSSPFPLSILITGVSWHALITVLFGWGAIGALLRRPRALFMLFAAAGLGLFWALWATFEWSESPPIIASATDFGLHAALTFAPLLASYWALYRFDLARWQPAPIGVAVVVALHLVWFVTADVVVYGLGLRAVLILTTLIALALFVLWIARGADKSANLLDGFRKHALLARQLVILGAAPVVATLLYAVALAFQPSLPQIHQMIYFVTALAGAILLVVATGQIVWRRRQAKHSTLSATGST